MPISGFGRILAVCSILFCHSLAAAEPGTDDGASHCFEQGTAYFRDSQFKKAADAFRCALEAGIDTPALHYNLGVAQMRLKDYEAAKSSFRQVIKDARWEGLGYYNLALAHYRQQEYAQARRWVRSVFASNAKPSVKELALKLYRRTLPQEQGGIWTGEAMLSTGWDSNITLGTTEAVSGVSKEDDFFIDVFGLFDYEFMGGTMDGFVIFASAYGLQYQTENDFDFFLGSTGVNKRLTAGRWYLEPGIFWEYAQLGHENYYYGISAKLDAKTHLNSAGELDLYLELQNVDEADSQFEYIAGTHLHASVGLGIRAGPGKLKPKYEFIRDDRSDFIEGGERYSYSPQIHQVSISYPLKLSSSWDFTPRLQFADTMFLTEEVRLDGRHETRHDQTWGSVLSVSQYIKRGWRVIGQVSYFDNQSNFDEFDYSRTLVSISVDGKF